MTYHDSHAINKLQYNARYRFRLPPRQHPCCVPNAIITLIYNYYYLSDPLV